ncbi:hypothetical protein Holit_01970 [Hollandina sp. SP2]
MRMLHLESGDVLIDREGRIAVTSLFDSRLFDLEGEDEQSLNQQHSTVLDGERIFFVPNPALGF